MSRSLRVSSRSVLGSSRLVSARYSRAHAVSPYLRQFIAPKLSPSPFLALPHARFLSGSAARLAAPTPSSKDEAAAGGEKAVAAAAKPKGTRLQRIWANVKHEASHYWHGTKLLGKEIRISARIQGRLLAGKKLTRREHRQLKRTTQDLLRLIPFSVFLIVPFMELLLPVALKLFPNMLPSTFTDSFKEDEKKRKLLKVRLEMAKFLQETIRESGIKSPSKIKESEDFKEFFRKVRSTGENPTTDEVVNVSRLFEDDLTLDNLTRPQLVSMCRYMNINAFGTDNFLRWTIRERMKKLKEDDKVINGEGLDALTTAELQAACQSRGIRTIGVSEDHLRYELGQWIDLHLNRGLSGTLLILSKAFAFNRPLPGAEGEDGDDIMRALKDTLASLPDNLLSETELEVSSDSASYKQRLEVLQQQEELIEDEEEQEQKESEARRQRKEKEEAARKEQDEQEKAAAHVTGEDLATQAGVASPTVVAVPSAIEEAPAAEEDEGEQVVDPADVRMTSEQVTELGQALEILSAKSSVIKERAELKKLIEDNRASEEEGGKPNPLAKRLKGILAKIEDQLTQYDAEVGDKLHMFETDHEGKIAVKDLKSALEVINHRPSDEAIAVLLEKLDVDHDSWVPLADIVNLAEGEGLGIVLDEADQSDDHSTAASPEGVVEESKSSYTKEPAKSTAPPSKAEAEAGAEKEKEKKEGGAKEDKKLKKEDIVEG